MIRPTSTPVRLCAALFFGLALGACDSDPTVENTDYVVIDRITISEASYEDLGSDGTGPDIYVNILSNGVVAFDTRDDAVGGVSEDELPVVIDPIDRIRVRFQPGRTLAIEVWDKDNDPIEGNTDDLMGQSEEIDLEELIENEAPRTLTLREEAGTPRMSVTLHLGYE